MTEKKRNILIGALFLALGVFIVVSSLHVEPRMKNDVGSGFYPMVVGIAIIVTALFRVITAFRQHSKIEKEKVATDRPGGWLTILLLCAYVLTFNKLGFLLSTGVYLLAQTWVLTPKEKWSWPIIGIVSILTPVFLYVLFVYALNIPLPKGILGF